MAQADRLVEMLRLECAAGKRIRRRQKRPKKFKQALVYNEDLSAEKAELLCLLKDIERYSQRTTYWSLVKAAVYGNADYKLARKEVHASRLRYCRALTLLIREGVMFRRKLGSERYIFTVPGAGLAQTQDSLPNDKLRGIPGTGA